MTYNTMYAWHEVRMWIGTVIAGATAVAAITSANPNLVPSLKRGFTNATEKVKLKANNLFKKKES